MEKVTRHIPVIFWIVLLSFLVRLAFLVNIPPTAITLAGDDAGYYEEAALQVREYFLKGGRLLKEFFVGNLFKGEGILDKYGLEIPWVAIKKGPVYPLFVGLFFWLGGPNPFWVFVAQALLISLAGGLLYGVARELGQEGAGLLSAFLVGIYPPFIFIAQKLFQESLPIFLFALFYFLAFRSRRTNSFWLFGVTGIVLLLLALTKSRLSLFPFFLFVTMGAAYPWISRKGFSRRNLLMLLFSFLIPYLLWAAVVSWQLRQPALFLEHGGTEIFSGTLPDYDGWTPDGFLTKDPDWAMAEVLNREGIAQTSEEGNWIWPSDSKLIGATLNTLWRYPLISLRMALERYKRLWWRPYEWPWSEYLFPSAPIRWLHGSLAVAAIGGLVLWWFERPLAVWFLSLPFLYALLTHSLFHCEHRYVVPFLGFPIFFASFFIHFLWTQREVLLGSFRKFAFILGFVLAAGIIFRLSHTALVLRVFPSLDAEAAHLLAAGIQSIVVLGFFLAAAFWLKQILSRRRLVTCLAVAVLFILIPFESSAFTAGDWRGWKAPLRGPAVGIRQDIFLPQESLGRSIARNLRMDLLLPQRGEAWFIRVNGESVGTLETLKANPSPYLVELSYHVYLKDMGRQSHDARQWFSLPLPPQILKEGTFNTIEIIFDQEASDSTSSSSDAWAVFGDYPASSPSPEFQGPLFHRSLNEISNFKYMYDGDFRLNGRTPLHHQGVKSFYRSEKREVSDDLSPSPGIQRGEYRIRIEIEDAEGKFRVY